MSKSIKQKKESPDLFCKKGVLENFAKFTGKHLCRSLFLNKVAGLYQKRDILQNFCKILFFMN